MTLREKLGGMFLLFFLVTASLGSAVTLVYDEGDLVKVVPEAEDIDNDEVAFTYSLPLNQSGEWQTDFDDAGRYTARVSAFDGKDRTEEDVTLVINNVNRAPEVTVQDMKAEEGELVDVGVDAQDSDGDELMVAFSSPLDENGRWQTTYDDAGIYPVTVTVSDGDAQTEETFTITLENTNRAPSIISALPDDEEQHIKETEELNFFAEGRDDDGDVLSYVWFVNGEQSGEGQEFTYRTDYDSAGDYDLSVEASDGTDKAQHRWTVEVENVNRAPSIQLDNVHIGENETLVLDLPEKDIDGDKLTYTIDEPMGDDGRWRTTFDDAGIYTVNVVASDGDLTDRTSFTITVDDVDRAPELADIDDVTLNENEELRVLLDAVDPDGDDLQFSLAGLDGATLENSEIFWNIGYDFVQLPDHFFARLLSRLRVDRFVYKPRRVMDALISACGKEKCSNQSFRVLVQNVNRVPLLEPIGDLTVREGDDVVVSPRASDSDNDYVRFSFSEPLNFRGRWKTDYEDAGGYPITVTASDGKERVNTSGNVFVDNVNRMPAFGRLTDKTVQENATLSFAVPVSDPDGDNITLIAEDLPSGAEFTDGVFIWKPDYDAVSAEEVENDFLVTFSVTDSLDIVDENASDVTVKKSLILTVTNTNRAPILSTSTPNATAIALVGQPVVFKVEAFDPDGDALRYQWKFGFLDTVEGHTAVRRTFSSVGEKKVTVTVSDGTDEVEHTWVVRVGRLRRRTVQ